MLLDAVVAIVFLALIAFALDRAGLTLPTLVRGVQQFLGH